VIQKGHSVSPALLIWLEANPRNITLIIEPYHPHMAQGRSEKE